MHHFKEFTRKDIPKLISWIPDARALLIWSGAGYVWPIDTTQLEQTLSKANNSDSTYLLLKFLSGKSVIGYIELRKLNNEESAARIGRVIIDPALRGQGLGNKIINMVKGYAINNFDLKTLSLGVFSFNQRAISAYQNNGFIVTGTKNEAKDFEDEKWDLVLMNCQL